MSYTVNQLALACAKFPRDSRETRHREISRRELVLEVVVVYEYNNTVLD